VTLDEARLDEICRPEQYVTNLRPMFDRLAELR
jgi:adenylosuccinate lyase